MLWGKSAGLGGRLAVTGAEELGVWDADGLLVLQEAKERHIAAARTREIIFFIFLSPL